MLKKLLKWLRSLFEKRDSKPNYHHIVVLDMPKRIELKTIYLVSNDGYVWQAVMKCPCGCDEVLYINLIEEQRPYWTYSIDEKKEISLYPSLHRKIECKSHFFLIKGKIVWV